MQNQYLYIVLTRTNTILSRLIQTIKNDEYTHAAISLDENLAHMYSFGRKYTYNPFIGRFKKEEIDTGLYEHCKTIPSVVIEIQVSNEQYDNVKELLDQFIINSNLYKYSYMGLVHGLLNKSASCEHRFLCSEFVYHILNKAGIIDFETSRNLVRPIDLLELDGRIIYQGDLKHINSLGEIENLERVYGI